MRPRSPAFVTTTIANLFEKPTFARGPDTWIDFSGFDPIALLTSGGGYRVQLGEIDDPGTLPAAFDIVSVVATVVPPQPALACGRDAGTCRGRLRP